MEHLIARTLKRLTLGEPVSAGAGLRVIPLIDPESTAEPNYDLLADALEAGRVEIDERKEGSRVTELVVRVRGTRPVLVPEGEILEGGLQTRTVNLTLLLGEGEHVIPVSCIEAGRWGRYRPFRAHPFLVDAEMRRKKVRTLKDRLVKSGEPRPDQAEVWAHVAGMHMTARVSSETASFVDLIRAYRSTIESDIRAVPSLPGQVGGIVEKAGCVLGIDVFGHPAVWSRMASKTLGGYAMAARWANVEGEPMNTGSFLQALERTQCREMPALVGLGYHLFPEGGPVTGFALVHAGQVLHLFATPEGLN